MDGMSGGLPSSAGRPAPAGPAYPGAAVTTHGLTRRFGAKMAVADVSFSVAAGEIFAFLGPNGAGKTTLLRMLLGLLAPSAGSAEMLGLDPARRARELRARVGYVSQLHSLYGELTVAENLQFFARAYGLKPERAAGAVGEQVERFRLADHLDAPVREQSTGVRRRAALAAALLHDPEVLILDEPTSGMDPGSRRRFWTFLGGLTEKAKTVLITTHHLEEVEGCDRLAVLLGGRLVFQGTPRDLREGFGGRVLEVAVPDDWGRAFVLLRGRFGASLAGRKVRLDPRKAPEAEVRRVLEGEGFRGVEIEARVPTLEDAFLRLAEEPDGTAS